MKRWSTRLLLIIFGLGLGLLFAELALRRILPPRPAGVDILAADDALLPLHEYRPGDPLGWRLGKSRHHGLYATNSFGFRDRERKREKPVGHRRILFLGDSIVFGSGLSAEVTLPRRLEALLGPAVEVWNLGVSGYNTVQEARLLAEVLPQTAPDEILLGYCANDAGPQPLIIPRPDGGYEYRYFTHPDMPITLPLPPAWDRFFALHSQLYRFLNELHFRIGAGRRLQDTGFRRISHAARDAALASLRETARQAGCRLRAVAFPFFESGKDGAQIALHADGLQALAAAGIPTLDLAPVYTAHDPAFLRLTPTDPLHLSPRGTQIVATHIARWLQDHPSAAVPLRKGPE